MTNLTIVQLKNHVKTLMYQSIDNERKTIKSEALEMIQKSNEISLDISTYNKSIEVAQSLYEKHIKGKEYYTKYITNTKDLSSVIVDKYSSLNCERIDKIVGQFNVIINKLSSMRSVNKAIEFLKIVGIEISEDKRQQEVIEVDIDFIKSILQKNKMITDGGKN